MTIGVGIIGASVGGWAAISHIPALRALPDYDVRAISTTRRASADLAAREFGVPDAFDNPADLIAAPGVDLVVVSVKVPHHHALISDALAAGKMVYSEWPLGVDSAEAADLAARAEAAGVRTVIGLQGGSLPVIRHVRDLVADGYVGRVLGSTLVGSALSWGAQTDTAHAYVYDAAFGVTPLTSSTLHAIEAVNTVLGDLATVSANLVTGRKEVMVADSGATVPVTVADQVSVTGTFRNGAALSLFYRGGFSRGDNFRWEINGTEGDLVLTAPGINGNLQALDLRLQGGRGNDQSVTDLPVPDALFLPVTPELPSTAQGVAHLYARFAQDLREGTETVPGFTHALQRHHLIDTIQRASRTGTTQTLN
ncbi:Predicted dehydrogenase [Nonomuraea maritima]|uniref:Predicted dehydrogenase n=1 Tax=Nonomuraea maritima TaxID=683260 RepID=A0A1G9B477_9ACTN|nr:Gfo/Idh/MocA family oxidoreductase [Nonomuraea maritima]SDK34288.1 Predicted dehydrogenase [Nonomuraea maritima]